MELLKSKNKLNPWETKTGSEFSKVRLFVRGAKYAHAHKLHLFSREQRVWWRDCYVKPNCGRNKRPALIKPLGKRIDGSSGDFDSSISIELIKSIIWDLQTRGLELIKSIIYDLRSILQESQLDRIVEFAEVVKTTQAERKS
jgi:hypothetical protein